MVVRNYKYNGLSLLQDSLGVYNYTANSEDGLVYTPNPPGSDLDTITGTATHTHHAFEGPDVLWTGVKMNLTHSSTEATPSYQNIISLYGLNDGHTQELIGEEIYTTLNSTPTTVKVAFDLLSSACQSALYKVDASSTAGTVRVNLPFRYTGNFENAYLIRQWLNSYPKRKSIPITGETFSCLDIPAEVTLLYDADMQADFDDIRFTDTDGITPLSCALLSKTDSTTSTFDVQIPLTPEDGAVKTIYAYYGNGSASSGSDPWGAYSYFYDDFEDGLYTSRTSPYTNWTLISGTPDVTTSSPLYGTYSLKLTGDGSSGVMTFPESHTSYTAKLRFKVVSQGAGTYAPYFNIFYPRYVDSNNHIKVHTAWDGVSKQVVRLTENKGGVETVLDSFDWIGSKVAAGQTNTWTILDTGNYIAVYIDTTLVLESYHTSTLSPGVKGVGCLYNCSGMWDRIRLYPYINVHPSVGAVGSEESATTYTVTPSTTGTNYLIFSTPSDWTQGGYWGMTVQEYGSSERSTRAVPMSAKDTFKLGYDAVDKYNTLRVGVSTSTVGVNYAIALDDLEYTYEV